MGNQSAHAKPCIRHPCLLVLKLLDHLLVNLQRTLVYDALADCTAVLHSVMYNSTNHVPTLYCLQDEQVTAPLAVHPVGELHPVVLYYLPTSCTAANQSDHVMGHVAFRARALQRRGCAVVHVTMQELQRWKNLDADGWREWGIAGRDMVKKVQLALRRVRGSGEAGGQS